MNASPFVITTTANSGKADFLVLFIHFIYLLGRLLGRIKFGQTLGGSSGPGASQIRGSRAIRVSIGSTQTVLAHSWICTKSVRSPRFRLLCPDDDLPN